MLAEKSVKMPPFYVYLFEHRGPASFSELFKGGREDYYGNNAMMIIVYVIKSTVNLVKLNYLYLGACHAEELQYLFPVALQLFVSASPTKSDRVLREAMLDMWVNFAKEG